MRTKEKVLTIHSSLKSALAEEKSSDKLIDVLPKNRILHINKPFEVCLLPVLLKFQSGKTKEKVGGKQRIEFRNVSGMSLQPAGQKPQNDERNYW
jgi:hypothetical protein